LWSTLPVAAILRGVSLVAIALLVLAAGLVAAAEWPRLSSRVGGDARRERQRARRRAQFRVVHPESEEFARAVERDLASLPTIDERDAKRR
jgi:hypothetical protein